MTVGAQEVLLREREDAVAMLRRHLRGDWGEVDKSDQRQNEWALKNGARLLSAYKTRLGTDIWIITEADRSVTTILLPEEY